MNDDFAPFELAVKLKEKGFNEKCLLHYESTGGFYSNSIDTYDRPNQELDYSDFQRCYNNGNSIGFIDAPAISQVLKWLRKKHFIHISTKPYPCEDGIMWMYEIRKFSEYISTVVKNKTGFIKEEQAALAGIEYVLDNLI